MFVKVPNRTPPRNVELIEWAHDTAMRRDGRNTQAVRIAVANESGEVAALVQLQNEDQLDAFLSAMKSQGFASPDKHDPAEHAHGCDYVYEGQLK